MKKRTALVAAVVLAMLMAAAPAMAASAPGHDNVVSAVPSTISPAVNDGQVQAIAQVAPPAGATSNPTMVIGGNFTNLTPKGGSATNRSGVAAFDAVTGALRSFNPVLNGEVFDVLEGPSPNTVYVVGKFTTVDGAFESHVALLDATTGAPVAGFKAASTNGAVNTVVRANGRLLLGGFFTTAGGQTHQGLAAIDETTGAIDHTYMNINVTERHNNSGSGAVGAIGVKDMEATPDGTRLIVTGNFRKANGLDRVQIAMVNLGTTAVVDPSWNTTKYAPLCYKTYFDSTMRGVSVSPDGKFFVIATTGGGTKNTLCDTAARWEFSSTGSDISPTWVDSTGGDTLWAVEVTETAVYVGGHQRWMNNVDGVDYANQGAVPRAGISALDLESGVPISWNPGRLPRGLAVFEILATPTGLWLGSDTDYIGNFKYKRPRLAFFPIAGGATQPSDRVATLPGEVYLASRATTPAVANNLGAISFDGASAASGPTSIDGRGVPWDSVRGAFMAGDQLFYGKTDGYLYKRTFTTSTTGAEVQIDPYNDPAWADANDGVGGVLRGKVPSFYGQISSLTGLFYANDRIYFTRSGDPNLYWRWFNVDSGIVGAQVFTANGGRSWTDTGGLFVNGNTLYIVSKATGRLQKMTFTGGVPSGTATTVDSGRDWRAKTVFIGPGTPPTNQPPVAAFTANCAERTCTVNAAGSRDDDGSIASYAWNYGDTTTATGVTPTPHQYAADGTYTITLTVTDNQGATHATTRDVTVTGPPAPASSVSFVGRDQVSGNTTNPQVTIPSSVQAGDQLLLIGSYGASGGAPAANPAGWTRLKDQANGTLEGVAWTKRAAAGDAGSTVSTPTALMKSSLSVVAYRGVAATGGIADVQSAVDSGTTDHRSPSAIAPDAGWVVQAWTDKSSGTSSWTPPSGVTVRGSVFGSQGGGEASAFVVDSGAGVAAGTYGNQVATTDAVSGKAISWTITLKDGAGAPPPSNVAPVADWSETHTDRAYDFDGSASSDADGSIASYAWDFGDGATATGATPPTHTYAVDGSYPVTLTVTDNLGATGSKTMTFDASGPPPPPPPASSVSFVGRDQTSGNTTTPQVRIPSGVQVDDQLLLFGTYGVSGGAPAAPSGWTQLNTVSNGTLEGVVWGKRAAAGDAGSTVSTTTALMKSSLSVMAYRGVASGGGIADVQGSGDSGTASHVSPSATAPDGGWVVQVWTDKSSGTTSWTPPSGVTVRGTVFGATGGGQASALLVDSGGPVSAGSRGGQTATTNSVSGKGIAWTLTLASGTGGPPPPPPPSNSAPVASFVESHSDRAYDFDGSASSDADGSIASYAWDFGDGATATGATPPTHTYAVDGSYPVTLTVTDNLGATHSKTLAVDASGPPPPPPPASSVSFVGRDQTSGNTTTPQVRIPSGVQVDDQLLLFGTYGVSGGAPAAPAGWTQLNTVSNGTFEGVVWGKRAAAGDAGSTVSTPTALMKSSLSVMAYRGVASGGGIADVQGSGDSGTASHVSPSATAPDGGWVVQVWTDKSSGTTSWTPPSGVTVRGTVFGATGGGQASALLVDSGGPVSAGSHGGQTATTNVASGRGIAWTLTLKTAP